MTQALTQAEIVAPGLSQEPDLPPDPRKNRPRVTFWHPDYVPLPSLVQAGKAPARRPLLVNLLTMDEIEKRIWWRCLQRTRPQVANALRDDVVLQLMKTFNGALALDGY